MAQLFVGVSVRVRCYWLLLALNAIPVWLGFEPIVPKWFLVIKMEPKF